MMRVRGYFDAEGSHRRSTGSSKHQKGARMNDNGNDRYKDKAEEAIGEKKTKPKPASDEDDGTNDNDEAEALAENPSFGITTQEESPKVNVAQNDNDVGRDSFLDLPQIQHGAVAVAGPDRNERDERRVSTPKRVLAERLQVSAERANTDNEYDRARCDENTVRPGAVAVPGPDADDDRREERVITPKRMLAERLQHSTESEETETTEGTSSDGAMEHTNEVARTEPSHYGEDAMASCDGIGDSQQVFEGNATQDMKHTETQDDAEDKP